MNQAESQEQRLIWAFWLAAGLAVLAGVLPVLIGGTSSRVATVIVPFGVGAAAFAGCAVLHSQGRGVTSALYFLAGLALVYGMLAMFSLPLQLAMLGTCPAPPAACTDGRHSHPRVLSHGQRSLQAIGAGGGRGRTCSEHGQLKG